MTMSKLYSRAYTQNKYLSMSPGQIILALYDGVLSSLEQAVYAMDEGDIAKQGEGIQKALRILTELQASLKTQNEDDISTSLFLLYDYVSRQLVYANLHDDRDTLMYCGSLIQEVRDGWAEMLKTQTTQLSPEDSESNGYL